MELESIDETTTHDTETTGGAGEENSASVSQAADGAGASQDGADSGEEVVNPDAQAAGESKDEEAGDEPVSYQANAKIKVHDYKNKVDREFEIPEKFKSLMTDADSEKEVREIFEKAHGIEFVKSRLGETRQQLEQEQARGAEIMGSINGLRGIYQSALKEGNYHKLDQFFGQLEIPQDVLFNYVKEKIKLMELPAEQRHVFEERLKAERHAETLGQANQQVMTQFEQQARQVKQLMLNQAIERPAVKSAIERYEAFVGRPGAFVDEVKRQGQLAWAQEKVDLTPDEAIERVIKAYNLGAIQSGTAIPQPGNAQVSGQKTVVVSNNRPNTIPNVGGRSSASPMKQKPKSIEDLKKLHQQMATEGQ